MIRAQARVGISAAERTYLRTRRTMLAVRRRDTDRRIRRQCFDTDKRSRRRCYLRRTRLRLRQSIRRSVKPIRHTHLDTAARAREGNTVNNAFLQCR